MHSLSLSMLGVYIYVGVMERISDVIVANMFLLRKFGRSSLFMTVNVWVADRLTMSPFSVASLYLFLLINFNWNSSDACVCACVCACSCVRVNVWSL